MTLEERIKQLEAARAVITDYIADACKNATIRAIEKAAEMTPPTGGDLAGTHTRTGEMKQHWATDSKIEPMGVALSDGGTYVTVLANNMQYASYVNDGHRMDRHFVPGLYINEESGLLEYDPTMDTGIVVGTKTFYVEGLHMVDAAKEEYRRVLAEELKKVEGLLI